MSEKLKWALELASRGFYILPLGVDTKTPFTTWKNIRTCDPEQITQWFTNHPRMNYGVCPGSGGAIIDIDVKKDKDGLSTFDALERQQDIADIIRGTTFTVRSPSMGYHFYLTTDEPVTNHSGFGHGIDVRGEGGYVVGPGCYYNGQDKEGDVAGYYTVELDLPFKAAPKWCVERMRADILKIKGGPDLIELDLPSSINQAKEFLTHHAPAIEGMDGGGDMHTFKTFAALCYNFGLTPETALEIAAHWKFTKPGETDPLSWNDRCEPPWEVYGSGNETLETKARNGSAYGQGQRGQMSGALYFQGLDLETIREATEAAIQMASIADDKRAKLEKMLMRGDSIFESIPPMKWAIPYWLPGAGITGIVGESGIGKSTILLDLALRFAHDLDWHGMPVRKGMTVIYCCGEDTEGAALQVRVWCKSQSLDVPSDRFVFVPSVPPFASHEEVNLWISVLREKVGKKDVIFFIDTWQRATSGLSQNDERDMQGATSSAEAIGRQLGGPVVIAFHSPKSNRATISGWEGQRNTANALWLLESEARGVKLTAQKIRGGQRDNSLVFGFRERASGLTDEYFGFDLKHVTVERVAGMRVDAEGVVYAEDDMFDIKRALADVLWELEAHRPQEQSAPKQYTTAQAAERLVGNPDYPSFGLPPLVERTDPWAKEQIAKLRAAKIQIPGCKHADLEALIRKALSGGGITLENGRYVYLMKAGNNQNRIVVEQNRLDCEI